MIKQSYQTPTLRLVLTTEFGNTTDITKSLEDETMGNVYEAIREALAGCGYVKETIDEWFSED